MSYDATDLVDPSTNTRLSRFRVTCRELASQRWTAILSFGVWLREQLTLGDYRLP